MLTVGVCGFILAARGKRLWDSECQTSRRIIKTHCKKQFHGIVYVRIEKRSRENRTGTAVDKPDENHIGQNIKELQEHLFRQRLIRSQLKSEM